jgi:hypothetical protein
MRKRAVGRRLPSNGLRIKPLRPRTSVIAAGLVPGDAIFHGRPHGKRKTAARITESEHDGSRVTVGLGDTERRRSEPAPLFLLGPSAIGCSRANLRRFRPNTKEHWRRTRTLPL